MHRRGGKRIRMDDPPPEYVNPMTPATPMTEYGGQSVHEPETPSYSGFNVGAGTVANSTAVEPPREDADESHHEDEENRSPSPTPTKRVTRSRGRRGDGGFPGRLAESPPPPPVRRRGRGGRGRGRGRGAAPPPAYSPPPVLLPGDDENSLYNILRFNKTAINQVVDMWIEEYKTNREVALVQLMQFFINSSGCRGKVSPDMAQMDHTLIIKKMTQEFDEESGEYPLIMSGQTWKKFRSNFCEFIQTLVKMCQYSIIYDQYLMDNIISLLTGLSDSQVRAFRHTATLAVMKLMTALVDVALLTSVNCDNCLRQYEAERLKARDKRATERLEVLVAKRQELEENMEEIKNMLSYMFKSVFVHRYRDTLPEIRSITMSEIGNWMEKFPAHFLDDLYLKYIGWTLHDKVGEVRLRCLQALQPLYECDELKGKLELFTSKFKDRIVSMSLDKETEVAVHAVKLVIAILKMHPDVLTDKDCENVYELVYSSWRGVAAAAGEFLNVRLFQPTAPVEPLRSRRGKLRLPNTSLVRDLVQFFIESELHEHGAYLVDSLIESNPMMKDWECMTDLLLEEAGPGEEALDNRQESSLIELMVCCVRQASTGEPPVGRQATRKQQQLSKDQAKVVQEDRARMTAHFITTLPALLDKFGADPEKLTNLASIPMYMDLELYTTQRQEAALTLLLNKLRDIVSVQTEAEVLETCGRALEYLCNDACAVYRRCNVARATITDMCVNRYKEAIDEYRTLIEGGETPDADEAFNVINSLRKVSIMYMCHDLNSTNIWDSLFEDLPKCVQDTETNMPPQALVYVVRSLFYSVLWSLHAVEERAAAGGGVSQEEVDMLRSRLRAYSHHCRNIIQHSPLVELKEEAYTSLCDLLIFFAEQLAIHAAIGAGGGAGSAAVMRTLVLEPEAELLDMLNDFIQEHVFVQHNYDGQDERRIEELHKRRNFLAAYCKLIVYNVAPIRRAADVFKHYIKCYNDYGDIIKLTITKARESSKLNCALTMVLAMQSLFKEILARNPSSPPELGELKELAKRFTVNFGLDPVKNREALTALHRAGIAFAALEPCPPAPPPHLHFLEPLAEFSNKLLRQDKRTVLKLLDSRIQHSVQWGEEWAPLTFYRNSLLTEAADERPNARKHYTRRTRHAEEEEAEENPESDAEQPGRARRRVRLPVSVRRTTLPRRRRAPPSPPSLSPSIHISSQESLHAQTRTTTHTDTDSTPARNLCSRRVSTHEQINETNLRYINGASSEFTSKKRSEIQKRSKEVSEMHENIVSSSKSSSSELRANKTHYDTRRSEIERTEVRNNNVRTNISGSSVLSTENSLPQARKSGEDSDIHEANVNKSTSSEPANKSGSKTLRIITDFVEIHEEKERSNKSSSSEMSTNKSHTNVHKNYVEDKGVSDSNGSRKSTSSELSGNNNHSNLHKSNTKDKNKDSNKPSSKVSAYNNHSKPVRTNEATDISDTNDFNTSTASEPSISKDSQKNRKSAEIPIALAVEAKRKNSKVNDESSISSETSSKEPQKRREVAPVISKALPTKARTKISNEALLVGSRSQQSEVIDESILKETPFRVNTKRKVHGGNVTVSAGKKLRMCDVWEGRAARDGGRKDEGTIEWDSEDTQFLSPSGSTASSECEDGGLLVVTAQVHRQQESDS